jgi:hypothetical protein
LGDIVQQVGYTPTGLAYSSNGSLWAWVYGR